MTVGQFAVTSRPAPEFGDRSAEVFVQLDDDVGTIEFPSNHGRSRILFRPRRSWATEVLTDAAILRESFEDERHSELLLVALPFSRDRLLQLDELLARWQRDFSAFNVELTQGRWSRFQLTVGPDPDYTSTIEKPTVRIDVDWCGISAVTVMIVDQSCIRIFNDGVSRWLRLNSPENT